MASNDRDPLALLTIAEVDAGSRLLKGDLVTAITHRTAQMWAALALVAFLLDRRTDPAAHINTYRAMTINQLTEHLGMTGGDDDDQAEQQLPAGPVELPDADDQPETVEDPTAPAPAS